MAFEDPIWAGNRKVVPIRGQGQLPGFETGPKRLPLTYFDQITPCTEALDFVEGLMVEGSAGVVYGESNSGKTFFMTDLALHVAAGMRWRDRDVDQGGVVYVALEGGIGFRNRIEAWRREQDTDQLVAFAAIMMPVNLLDPDADTEGLIAAIEEAGEHIGMPVKLVVIDTLSRAMAGGNENAPDDMGALVMNMDRIRDATKAAVWFVHHSGKDQAKGARGHSLLRAAIDTEIEVVATTDTGPRTAAVVKQRELPKGDSFEFTLKIVELGQNKRGKPVTSCVVEGSGMGDTAGAVLMPRLKGHPQRALEVLHDLLAESGKGGFRGTPDGVISVPADWWRDRFYERACPGDGAEAKKKAFQRASARLIDQHIVSMGVNRVWLTRRTRNSENHEEVHDVE
jgi:KaiC/GvpD/RAD55 family RecA-like ATPase